MLSWAAGDTDRLERDLLPPGVGGLLGPEGLYVEAVLLSRRPRREHDRRRRDFLPPRARIRALRSRG